MANSFYDELVNRKGIDKLLEESSKKENNLEKEVSVVPYEKKEVARIKREQNYKALKIIERNILIGGEYAIKGGYELAKSPFMLPTSIRKYPNILILIVPITIIPILSLGFLIDGLSKSNLPEAIIGGTTILTNIGSGLYKWHRYEKNKLKGGEKNE